MSQNDVSRLLVIGNGFDLKCALKSKFEDYYNSRVDMVTLLNKMNSTFDDPSVDQEILQGDLFSTLGYNTKDFGNLNELSNINLIDKNISFWDF